MERDTPGKKTVVLSCLYSVYLHLNQSMKLELLKRYPDKETVDRNVLYLKKENNRQIRERSFFWKKGKIANQKFRIWWHEKCK